MQTRFGESLSPCELELFDSFVEHMWVWGEMEKLDTVLYIHSKIFYFGMVVLVGSLIVPGLMSR